MREYYKVPKPIVKIIINMYFVYYYGEDYCIENCMFGTYNYLTGYNAKIVRVLRGESVLIFEDFIHNWVHKLIKNVAVIGNNKIVTDLYENYNKLPQMPQYRYISFGSVVEFDNFICLRLAIQNNNFATAELVAKLYGKCINFRYGNLINDFNTIQFDFCITLDTNARKLKTKFIKTKKISFDYIDALVKKYSANYIFEFSNNKLVKQYVAPLCTPDVRVNTKVNAELLMSYGIYPRQCIFSARTPVEIIESMPYYINKYPELYIGYFNVSLLRKHINNIKFSKIQPIFQDIIDCAYQYFISYEDVGCAGKIFEYVTIDIIKKYFKFQSKRFVGKLFDRYISRRELWELFNPHTAPFDILKYRGYGPFCDWYYIRYC